MLYSAEYCMLPIRHRKAQEEATCSVLCSGLIWSWPHRSLVLASIKSLPSSTWRTLIWTGLTMDEDLNATQHCIRGNLPSNRINGYANSCYVPARRRKRSSGRRRCNFRVLLMVKSPRRSAPRPHPIPYCPSMLSRSGTFLGCQALVHDDYPSKKRRQSIPKVRRARSLSRTPLWKSTIRTYPRSLLCVGRNPTCPPTESQFWRRGGLIGSAWSSLCQISGPRIPCLILV